MVTNSVSPFEGALVWVGTPSQGTSQSTGQPWKVVDFVLKYTDHKMQEQYMVLTASGVERVDKLLSLPIGTMLRVDFQITARKSDYNGQEKWWGSLAVFRITPLVGEQAKLAQPVQQPVATQPVFQQPIQQGPLQPAKQQASALDDLPEDNLPF